MPTSAPNVKAPPGAVDCHFHIFGPHAVFPMSPGRTYSPPEALVPEYLAMAAVLGIERMVVVQASTHGTDNRVTLDAVEKFGRHRAVAVAVIGDSFDDAALKRLAAAGTVGVRFNMVSGNGTPVDQLDRIARRIAPLGWHIQIYAEGEQLEELAPYLAKLPVPVCIDHMGGVKPALGTNHPQFRALLGLMEREHVWIKLCPYLASSAGPPFTDMEANTRALVAIAPGRCVWGTNWPHPKQEPAPDEGHLLDLLTDWTDRATRDTILVANPARLYGFPAR